MGLQADMRAAAVTLLKDYGKDAGVKLTVYRARPLTLHPPEAFVDIVRESIVYSGPTLRQRTPQVDMIVVHGVFDSGDAADQKDAFVDGFLDWVNTRFHAAGPNTIAGVTDTEDVPDYVAQWIGPTVYYATRITLEGYATN